MQAILITCVQVEERVEAIYRELSGHPAAGEDLKTIWRSMADDEARHARRIRLVADRLEMAGVESLELNAQEVQDLLDRAGEILQDVQEGRLSVEQAIYASVELEDAFLAVHLAYGAVQNHPDLQTMFRSLAEEDRKHTFALREYLDRMHDGSGPDIVDPELP